MSDYRPLKSLAAELGISERQFHRRLDSKEPSACGKLRSEVAWVEASRFSMLICELQACGELVQRCDPEIKSMLEAVARKLSAWCDSAPENTFRIEHDRRMDDLLDHPLVDDERYEELRQDLTKLPPTPKELEAEDDEALKGLV